MKLSSMTRGLAILLVAVATAALATDDAAKAKTASLQIDATGPFPFSASSSKTTIWLPVKLPDAVGAADLTLTRQSVRFERQPSAEITQRFVVAPQLIDKDRTTPTLAIEISEIELLRPGQYDLAVSVTSKSKVTVAPLTIALERRAAQLTPPGRQTIDVNVEWPWSTSMEGTSAPAALRLLLAEEGRDSAVRGVTILDGPFTSSDGNVRATLGATASSAPATQYLSLDLRPAGFPVGSSQGKLEIHSPDLKAPSVVEVEIRARLAKYWIPIMVAAGLMLGFLLRIELQHRLDPAKAKQQGLAGLDEFNRQRNGVLDQIFSRAVADEFARLERAILGDDPQVIGAKLTETQAAVKLAADDLKKRLDEAVELLDELRTRVPGTGLLPPTMQTVVDSLGAVAAAGVEKLKARDAKGIKDDVTVALAGAAKTLRLESARSMSILGWANASYQEVLSLLDRETADERGPQLKAAFESVPASLTPPAAFSNVAEIAAFLDEWRTYGASRLIAIANLRANLDADSKTLEGFITKAANSSASLAGFVQAWRDALKRVSEGMSHDVVASEAFTLPSWTARPVHQAMLEVLAAVKKARPDVKDAALATFEAAVDARDYFDAFRQLPPIPAGMQVLSSSRSTSAPGGAAAADDALATPGPLRHVAGSTLPSRDLLSDPRTLEVYAVRNRKQLALTNAVQTIAVGSILAVASVAFFGDRFMGTAMELAGLFFWGFTADFSVSKLSEIAVGWATKPKPPAA